MAMHSPVATESAMRFLMVYLRQVGRFAPAGGVAALTLYTLARHEFARQRAHVSSRRLLLDPQTCAGADGLYGSAVGEPRHHIAFLGDSLAYGLGAERAEDTPGAVVARKVASLAQAPVRLSVLAECGRGSDALAEQVARAIELGVDTVVISIGANNIRDLPIHPAKAQRALAKSVAELQAAVGQLATAGIPAVVLTCPDMSLTPALQLWYAPATSLLCRHFAAAQTRVSLQAGARTVSLGDLCARLAENPSIGFSSIDGMHPSSEGYALSGNVIARSVAEALGYSVVPSRVATAATLAQASQKPLTALHPAGAAAPPRAPSAAPAPPAPSAAPAPPAPPRIGRTAARLRAGIAPPRVASP